MMACALWLLKLEESNFNFIRTKRSKAKVDESLQKN